jgi:hypothetical protein
MTTATGDPHYAWGCWCGIDHLGYVNSAPPPLRSTKRPFRCPVCNGVGTVSAGYYSRAGDVLSWTVGSTAPEECRSCKGTGIVWAPE